MAHFFSKHFLLMCLLLLQMKLGFADSFLTPHSGFTPSQIALVINDDDVLSVQIGEYYQQARHLSPEHIIHVHLGELSTQTKLTRQQFEPLNSFIKSNLDDTVQAVVFAWVKPYAVNCVSLTTAFTRGVNETLCKNTCGKSRPSPYFNSTSQFPWQDYGMRLSMLLAATNFENAKALIDRGVAADKTSPEKAAAYLLITSDKRRSSRAVTFPKSQQIMNPDLHIYTQHEDALRWKGNIMFYLTGHVTVPFLSTLSFLPGALADHLTSFGGDLLGSSQMSSLRWLEAGATASYGTVSEPCSYPQKFPNASVLIHHYLQGESAIETYWKSVEWTDQGVFIGEPLAAPYRK